MKITVQVSLYSPALDAEAEYTVIPYYQVKKNKRLFFQLRRNRIQYVHVLDSTPLSKPESII